LVWFFRTKTGSNRSVWLCFFVLTQFFCLALFFWFGSVFSSFFCLDSIYFFRFQAYKTKTKPNWSVFLNFNWFNWFFLQFGFFSYFFLIFSVLLIFYSLIIFYFIISMKYLHLEINFYRSFNIGNSMLFIFLEFSLPIPSISCYTFFWKFFYLYFLIKKSFRMAARFPMKSNLKGFKPLTFFSHSLYGPNNK